MNKLTLIILIALSLEIMACSASKKTAMTEDVAEIEEIDQLEELDQLKDEPMMAPLTEDEKYQTRLLEYKKLVAEQVAAYPDSLLVSWERGGCYGRCPIYKVRIYKSGFTEYESIRWTNKEDGFYTSKFTIEEIEKIIEKAKKIHFFELEDFYDSEVSDLPSFFVYINDNSKRKGVRDRRLGPRELKDFITYLDSLLETKELLFKK